MASAPFRTDPRVLTEEDIAALREADRIRKSRGLPGIGQELREFVSRHTPSPEATSSIVVSKASAIVVPSVAVIVDCSEPAWCPEGWTVAPEGEQIGSRFRGKFALTPESLAFHLDPGQQDGKNMKGTVLRTVLAGTPVLPATVLDYLLEHQEFIPESWKVKAVFFFWGTVYRGSDGRLDVRFLCWNCDFWRWDYFRLEYCWDSKCPSAVPAS